MSAALTPAELERLRNICARLESDFEGERAAAGLLASRLHRDRGLVCADVVQSAPTEHSTPQPSAPPWRSTVRKFLDKPGSLRAWEKEEFLPSLLRLFQKLSPKQRAVLNQIADRVLGRVA
jgi:hypothetical protein